MLDTTELIKDTENTSPEIRAFGWIDELKKYEDKKDKEIFDKRLTEFVDLLLKEDKTEVSLRTMKTIVTNVNCGNSVTIPSMRNFADRYGSYIISLTKPIEGYKHPAEEDANVEIVKMPGD